MLTKIFLSILFLASFSLQSLARSGEDGWVSSGGEIFLYARNPWFVKNVKTVNYCILIDNQSMNASSDTIRSSVKSAFDYWKNEIGLDTFPDSKGFADLATQNFIEQESCDDTTDIRFKMGYGTLTQDEIDYLKDSSIYVGISVRTDYDLKTLKGKGFVYISSDKGPHAYKNSGELLTDAWKEPKLLQYALIHEIGHIMGIPHTGAGIMSEIFLNQVINARFSQFYINSPLQHFLLEPRQFEVCNSIQKMTGEFNANFFMIDQNTNCLKFEAQDNAGENWLVTATDLVSKDYKPVGSVHMNAISAVDFGAKPAVIVQLPPEQTVFGIEDRFVNTYMIGPLFRNRNLQGFFETTSSHRPYPLQIQLNPDFVSFTGTVNGRMLPVMTYTQPSLIKMILPF